MQPKYQVPNSAVSPDLLGNANLDALSKQGSTFILVMSYLASRRTLSYASPQDFGFNLVL